MLLLIAYMFTPDFPVTPDGSVRWTLNYIDKAPVLIAPDAPQETLDWLAQPAEELGKHLNSGHMGNVYHIEDTGLVIKESHRNAFPESHAKWRRNSAMPAFFLNVALETGLERIGDEARLPSGARLTTPTHLGVYATKSISRIIMTFEPGTPAYPGGLAGNSVQRRKIYDNAFQAVGGNPARLMGYDDTYDNLLIREGEVVKLDACNIAF